MCDKGCGCETGRSAGVGLSEENGVGILVVDDDADCRLLVRDAIAESGVMSRVFEVDSGEQAWRFLNGEGEFAAVPRPGLIYLDVEMPGMGGIQLLRQIKSHPSLREITVVMVTGVTDECQMRAAMTAGANSYTLKPADAGQFLRGVTQCTRYWLGVHQRPEQHRADGAYRR